MDGGLEFQGCVRDNYRVGRKMELRLPVRPSVRPSDHVARSFIKAAARAVMDWPGRGGPKGPGKNISYPLPPFLLCSPLHFSASYLGMFLAVCNTSCYIFTCLSLGLISLFSSCLSSLLDCLFIALLLYCYPLCH